VNETTPARLLGDLTWERYADGRLHRLKRGKHYVGTGRDMQRLAGEAAAELGAGVQVVREELGQRNHYLWVQFTDQQLPMGAPCGRCGSGHIARTHGHFGFCEDCRATILFSGTLEDAVGDARAPLLKGRMERALAPTALERFSDARVTFWGVEGEWERWRGRAVDADGATMLVLLEYWLDEEGRRRQDGAGRDQVQVRVFPAEPFRDVLDLDRLDEGDLPEVLRGLRS
jgi:hypothetical protein